MSFKRHRYEQQRGAQWSTKTLTVYMQGCHDSFEYTVDDVLPVSLLPLVNGLLLPCVLLCSPARYRLDEEFIVYLLGLLSGYLAPLPRIGTSRPL